MITVMEETFQDFPLGPFPYDIKHSAAGEYHYYPPQGYTGSWYDPIVYHGWLGPTWIITERDAIRYMEQTRPQLAIREDIWPTLVAGDTSWQDYVVEAVVRPLSTRSHVGLLFRYTHSRKAYFFGFEGGKVRMIRRYQDEFVEIGSAPYAYDTDHEYQLKVECVGSRLVGYVDGRELISVEDDAYPAGKIGLTARMPAQFTDVRVSMEEQAHAGWRERVKREQAELAQLRASYPQPKLWKRIDLQNFGTARQIRFGHLLGTKELQIVLAQHQKRGHKDAYAHISCLTAIDLDGNVLWQIGEPSTNFDHALLTADLPLQVHDIDGDGFDEVITAIDFRLMILDGRTGEVKRSVRTPLSDDPDDVLHSVPFRQYAFDRVNVDAIRIANFSGKDRPTDIIIKDRYSRVWVYNSDLQLMWKFRGRNTGHFPYTADVDGDGRDEMFVGYHLVDHDGRLLWTLPVPTDHTDEILIGRWDVSEPRQQICIVSGDEGMMIADLDGRLLVKHNIGHAQRISTGNYRPELDGLELCATTFWGYQGIVYLFDCKGRLLHEFEPTCNGNVITPVNWTGDGRDLILLNGNVQRGGLIDGHGRRVVVFPDDGHPDLCAEVLNLTGDARDEIVLWDNRWMYIYTQDRPADAEHVVVPEKYPLYNASNYRGEFHYPKR